MANDPLVWFLMRDKLEFTYYFFSGGSNIYCKKSSGICEFRNNKLWSSSG